MTSLETPVSPTPSALPTKPAWWKTWTQPIKVLLVLLVALSLLATLSWADWRLNADEWITAVLKLGMLFAGASVTMRLLTFVGYKPSVRWEHRVISCLILFLLFAPDAPWWGFVVVGALTEGLQRVLRLPTGPLANPAALGTLVAAVVFGSWGVLPTWWGVSFSPRWDLLGLVPEGLSIATLLLLPVAVWIAWKYKKLWTAGALVASTALAYWVTFAVIPTYLLLEGTLLFFALVMAVEPKSSPVVRNEQIIFGTGVGILLVILLKFYFVEAYTGALVTGNVIYNGRRWWTLRMARQRAIRK